MKLKSYVAPQLRKYVAVDSVIGGIIVEPSPYSKDTIHLNILKTLSQDWKHVDEMSFFLLPEDALKLARHLILRANEIIQEGK